MWRVSVPFWDVLADVLQRGAVERGAPDLGEHNDYVFSELATEPERRRHQIQEAR